MSAPQTLRPGRYRHFKGREYELLFVATHSETLEPMVVYRALYGSGASGCAPPPCGTSRSSATGRSCAALLTSGTEFQTEKARRITRSGALGVCI